jgi:hypothetical protein
MSVVAAPPPTWLDLAESLDVSVGRSEAAMAAAFRTRRSELLQDLEAGVRSPLWPSASLLRLRAARLAEVTAIEQALEAGGWQVEEEQ